MNLLQRLKLSGTLAVLVFTALLAGCDAADTFTDNIKETAETVGEEIESSAEKVAEESVALVEKMGKGGEAFLNEFKK